MESNGTFLTLLLVLITCLVSIAAFKNERFLRLLIFNPYTVHRKNEWHRLLTCGFIHADWMHLLINMFVLFSFGGIVEQYYRLYFGENAILYFLILYFGGIIASILPTYFLQKNNPSYHSLGASGAVAAVLFSYILFQPIEKICLYGIFCLPGIVLGLAYLVYSWYAARKNTDAINHDAHFWGAIYGVLINLVFNPGIGPVFLEQVREINLF